MMDLSLLKNLYEKKHFLICESFPRWEDAVKMSVQPLIDTGAVKPEYADRVVEMVKTYGPYICICPHVAIPHAAAPELSNVDVPVMSFMKVNQPVDFCGEENETAELFFAMAAPSGSSHLDDIQILVEFLESDGVIDALLEARSEDDFKKLLEL